MTPESILNLVLGRGSVLSCELEQTEKSIGKLITFDFALLKSFEFTP
jgi:hypothetical protein